MLIFFDNVLTYNLGFPWQQHQPRYWSLRYTSLTLLTLLPWTSPEKRSCWRIWITSQVKMSPNVDRHTLLINVNSRFEVRILQGFVKSRPYVFIGSFDFVLCLKFPSSFKCWFYLKLLSGSTEFEVRNFSF